MTMLTAIIVFAYGLAIGSFLNVCIYRLPKGESVVFTPSHCMHCNKPIEGRDLIPLFSYLILKGKCRFCKARLSLQYPIVEVLNAILCMVLYLIYGLNAQFILFALLASVLIVITFIDLEHRIIPDSLVIITAILGIVYHIYRWVTIPDYTPNAISALIGFFAASSLLLLLAVISKGGMGGGDIKMMAVFGLCLGWQQILLALFIASIYGSVTGGLLMLKKQAELKTAVPFGPFLAAGIFTILCTGDGLLKWYLSLISG